MNISELISKLTELKELHGDIEVQINDNDTGWELPISSIETYGDVILMYGNYRP